MKSKHVESSNVDATRQYPIADTQALLASNSETWYPPLGKKWTKRQTFYRSMTTDKLVNSLHDVRRLRFSTALHLFCRSLWLGIGAEDEIRLMVCEFTRRGLDLEGLLRIGEEADAGAPFLE